MKPFLIFLLSGLYVYADNPFMTDPYGKKFVAATIPKEIELRTVRLKDMKLGETVRVYADAMVMDKNEQCWLNPEYIAIPIKDFDRWDLDVVRIKLGYIVRVKYNYKVVNGYSIPVNSQWKVGYAAPSYIPVKAIRVEKPYYEKASPSRLKSLDLQKDYDPKFVIPKVPPNPYVLEKQNVRRTVPARVDANQSSSPVLRAEPVRPNASPAPSPGIDPDSGLEQLLPELFK